jgi:hypothetical protein
MNDLDDLLTGFKTLENLLAYSTVFDPFHKVADDRQGNVGFKQCKPYFTHGGVYVGFGELTGAP